MQKYDTIDWDIGDNLLYLFFEFRIIKNLSPNNFELFYKAKGKAKKVHMTKKNCFYQRIHISYPIITKLCQNKLLMSHEGDILAKFCYDLGKFVDF